MSAPNARISILLAALAPFILATGAWALPPEVDFNDGVDAASVPLFSAYGPHEGAAFGSSFARAMSSIGMAAGDLDADGIDDLAVGAPLGNGLISLDSGSALVFFGGADRPATSVNLTAEGVTGPQRFFVMPEGVEDHTGEALAIGDYNGDGFDDLAVGVPFASPDNRFFAGRIVILYGPLTPGDTIDLAQPHGTWGETRIWPRTASDGYARTLQTLDFNGDGYDDLAISGSFLLDTMTLDVLFGAPDLPGRFLDLANASDYGELLRMRSFNGGAANSFSEMLAAGDFDGDGVDDLAFNNGFTSRVTIVFGGSHIVPGEAFHDSSALLFHRARFEHTGKPLSDRPRVAAGDLDGDGIDDLLISSFFIQHSPTPGASTGTVYVAFGGSLRGRDFDFAEADDLDDVWLLRNTTSGERLGLMATLADVDGDGGADVIATHGDDSGFRSDVFVWRGTGIMRDTVTTLDESPPDSRIIRPDVPSISDFGRAIVGGFDLDANGTGDLAIAAPRMDSPGSDPADDSGMVGVVLGAADTDDPDTAVGRIHHAAGSTIMRGVGGRLSPTMRTRIAFADGDTDGGASLTTVTLDRDVAVLPPAALKAWNVESDRTGWTSATLEFRWTEAQETAIRAAGVPALYGASSEAGPWTRLTDAVVEPARRRATIEAPTLGWFAIGAEPVASSGLTTQ